MSEKFIFTEEELEIIRNGQVLGSYYPGEEVSGEPSVNENLEEEQ